MQDPNNPTVPLDPTATDPAPVPGTVPPGPAAVSTDDETAEATELALLRQQVDALQAQNRMLSQPNLATTSTTEPAPPAAPRSFRNDLWNVLMVRLGQHDLVIAPDEDVKP